jgi:3-hydroxy-9,10-secoandrosta-1,3,5(10)-triene-9,17-dione monooxygenase
VAESELLSFARDRVPVLRERAQEAEKLRRVPDETVKELRGAGLFRMLQPARFGGLERGFEEFADVVSEIGRGCGSTAWCLSILGVHNWFLALFEEAAQEDVWGASPEALFATSFAPTGQAVAEEGGYRVKGRWQFASGCDHSDWVVVGAMVPHDEPRPIPDFRSFLIPRRDIAIDDTWFVAGLKGTGSKDLVIEDAFVPAYRTLSLPEAVMGNAPGLKVNRGAIYQVPFSSVLALGVTPAAVGIARSALEAFRERTRERVMAYTDRKMVEQVPAQIRIAESSVEIDAAELLIQRTCREVMERSGSAEATEITVRAQVRRDLAYVVRLCTRAVDRLFEASGAHALFDASPIQRGFRDLHAMAAHPFVNWDTTAEIFGRTDLGLPPKVGIV